MVIQAPWQGQNNAKNIKVMGSSNGYFSIQNNLNGSETFRAIFEGGVNLAYYQSGTKLQTTTTGVTLNQDLTVNRNALITGISTFTGAIDANGDLDIDGHTNLDNVSIAGITTFSNATTIVNGGYHRGIINSGAQAKIIGGYISGSDTLRLGESMYLTTTGLGINESSPGHRLTIGGDGYFGFTTPNDAARQIIFNANRGSAGDTLANINWQWNSKNVAQIRGIAGSDTTNKDDGHLAFFTSSANNLSERVRINSSGKVGIAFQFNYTMNTDSTDLVIGNGGGAKGMTFWTAAGADSQTISFQTNESLSRAEGEISYGPTNTSTSANRNVMMFRTNSSERLRIGSAGQIGIAGANYGTSGQVLTSGGSGSAASWSTVSGTTINSNTNNYVITGTGTANTLQGESTLTFDGTKLEAPRIDSKGLIHIEYSSSTNTNYMMTMNNNNGIMHIFRGDALYIGNNMNTSNQGSGPNNRAISLKTNGDIIATGNLTASGYIDSSSDIKLKTNIKTIDNALHKVLQLRGAEYDRIDKDNQHEVGVIAQEVEKIIPEVVHGDETKTVSYGNMVAVLIEAIKEQNEVINKMKKEIAELKSS